MSEALLGREEMIEQNLGLVHLCAHRFKGRGIEYDDLFQAGCMGLIKATDAFDAGRGVKFSTYAVPVILGEMRRLFRDGGSVKVGRTLKEQSLKATRIRENFLTKEGREPTVSEIAEELGTDEETAAMAVSASIPPMSLTENEEEGGGQFDIPVQSHEEGIADLLSLQEVMTTLEDRDRMLIELRYFKNQTQTQTAKVLGMTQVQVSRREKKILLMMREKLLN